MLNNVFVFTADLKVIATFLNIDTQYTDLFEKYNNWQLTNNKKLR